MNSNISSTPKSRIAWTTISPIFGWKTVNEYVQRELGDDEQDGKKIRRAEERAENLLKPRPVKGLRSLVSL